MQGVVLAAACVCVFEERVTIKFGQASGVVAGGKRI